MTALAIRKVYRMATNRGNLAKPRPNERSVTRISTKPEKQRCLIQLNPICKSYASAENQTQVLNNINLKIQEREFVAIVGFSGSGKTTLISIIGHSGCGKSTVLSMTAGLNEVSEGGIVLDNKEIVSAGRDRGVVFQAPSLFRWFTAFENVALGVEKVYPHAHPREQTGIIEYYLTRSGSAARCTKRPPNYPRVCASGSESPEPLRFHRNCYCSTNLLACWIP